MNTSVDSVDDADDRLALAGVVRDGLLCRLPTVAQAPRSRTIAADLSAPVLASLLDLHIAIAAAWTRRAAHDWALCPAARDLPRRSG
ncbi:hypothetical protein [Frankia sp. KB5]|uniref:hypothetical protein n=1 Tax=Frankia sp. KB5 TaxID=683318 RepID=UPI000A0F8341|nr:hypothetical protein [Frankia sp. KB5]ORT47787.1 hypothetical protein KBI5_17740 [Frankia sp. KB5]